MKVICKKSLSKRITVGKIYDLVDNIEFPNNSFCRYYLIADDNEKLYIVSYYADDMFFSGIDEVRNKKLEDLGI